MEPPEWSSFEFHLSCFREDKRLFGGNLRSAAFSSGGELLAVGTSNHEIWIWNTRDWTLRDYWGNVNAFDLRFVENDYCLVSISPNANSTVWKLSDVLLKRPETHGDRVESIKVTSDDKYLFSLSSGTSRVWNAKTGDFLWSLSDWVTTFAISKEGRYLVTQAWTEVVLWNLETRVRMIGFRSTIPYLDVLGIGFLSSGRLAIIWAELKIYDIETKKLSSILKEEITALDNHAWSITGVQISLTAHAFSSDGRWLAFGSRWGDLEVWDSECEKFYRLEKAHSSKVTAIEFFGNAIISRAYPREGARERDSLAFLERSNPSLHIWMPLDDLKYAWNGFKEACLIDGHSPLFLLKDKEDIDVYSIKESTCSLIHNFRVDQIKCLSEFLTEKYPDITLLQDDYERITASPENQEKTFYDFKMAVHPSNGDQSLIPWFFME